MSPFNSENLSNMCLAVRYSKVENVEIPQMELCSSLLYYYLVLDRFLGSFLFFIEGLEGYFLVERSTYRSNYFKFMLSCLGFLLL